MSHACGVLPVDKPAGVTSHDVVAAIRRASGLRKVGHAGTLDPLATGLLLICVGAATRISEYLAGHEKSYSVVARLGAETDTYDADGRIVASHAGALPDDRSIDRAVSSMVGTLEQVPPPFSAVKQAGKPLYWYARRGDSPAVSPRTVTVLRLSWSRLDDSSIALEVRCSAGTYVRSLVHDLGRMLGCGAHVASLRRTSIGKLVVSEAVSLPEAERRLAAGDWSPVLSLSQALSDMPTLVLPSEAVRRMQRGQSVTLDVEGQPGPHLALNEHGQAIAIVEPGSEPGLWRPHKVLCTEENACLER